MAQLRVYELARELGVSSNEVMAMANSQGEFVRSASSTLSPPVAATLRRAFQQTAAPAQIQRRRPAAPPKPSPKQDDPRQVAADLFGVPAAQIRTRREARNRTTTSGRRVDPVEARWAKERMFEPEETRAWLAAGLGPADDALAYQCKSAGLRPQDLRVKLGVASLSGNASLAANQCQPCGRASSRSDKEALAKF